MSGTAKPLRNRRKVNLTCFCGRKYKALAYNVANGHTKSCGCLRRIRAMQNFTKHGHATRRGKTAEYRIWKGIRQRCFDKNAPIYKYYGARGITICERWNSFENFLVDMGMRPKGLCIERVNNDGNYEPKNCKWATMKEQRANRRDSIGRNSKTSH